MTYAKMQLAGGVVDADGDRWCKCQKCNQDFHIAAELEPCAFCNYCANDVLDILAEALIIAAKKSSRLSYAEKR